MQHVTAPLAPEAQLARAAGSLAAGVSASGRLNPALGHPVFVQRAEGARLWTVDGHELIDFNLSHGATILGHGHPAIERAVRDGLAIGAPSAYETEAHARAARLIQSLVPAAERVRFANSGTEANQAALRLARAHTGRAKILKFEGHFHGLHDYVMWNANTPPVPLVDGTYVPPGPESAGIPPRIAEDLIVVPWNDGDAVVRAMTEHGDDIAAILCEPVNYNSGCIEPAPGFLALLRALADRHGALLVFDEVLSGFRMCLGGAQVHYGVTPDLCTLAKAIGNGMPVAVLAGREAVMDSLAPTGGAAHSGTYTGHIFSVLAVEACLTELAEPGVYDTLDRVCAQLVAGIVSTLRRYEVTARVQRLGARFGLYFGVDQAITSYRQAGTIDATRAAAFSRACYRRGVYFHNYGRIAIGHHGVSLAHTPEVIDEAVARIDVAVAEMVG